MISDLGIEKNDFINSAFADLARSLTWIPRTKTVSNVTGSVTYTNNTPVELYAIFTKRRTRYDWAKEGMVEEGDAFMQVKEEIEIMKEDLIQTDDETYRVDEVLLRQPGGTRFFKSIILFKVDDI